MIELINTFVRVDITWWAQAHYVGSTWSAYDSLEEHVKHNACRECKYICYKVT
jgi:hypothetical protein